MQISREIYLDNGATTFPKPECVYQAIESFMRGCGGSHGRAAHRKAKEADDIILKARKAAARLFKVKNFSRIVFTANSTESINMAIKGVLNPGDHVIITDLEHNAVLRPLWNLKLKFGIEISVVETDTDGFLDPAKIQEAITGKTRLICCVHANNVMGTILPVKEVAEIAHKRGIPLLVDSSQSAGVIPIDLESLQIDLLAFTGHKGLMGPQGTGGLYICEGLELEPLKQGGTGISSESPEQPNTMPENYESGTANTFGIAGLLAGIEFIEKEGIEKIQKHEIELNAMFMESLSKLKGATVYGPKDPCKKTGITLMNFSSLDPSDIGQMLDKRFGIMVRTGLHCSALSHRKIKTERKGAIRFSFGYFNTKEDVDYTIFALQEISKAMY